jgi:hypothetical protein
MSDDRDAEDVVWQDDHYEQPCIMCGVVDTLNNLVTLFVADECLPPGLRKNDDDDNYLGSDDDYIADPVHAHKECLRKYQQNAWALSTLTMEAQLEAKMTPDEWKELGERRQGLS